MQYHTHSPEETRAVAREWAALLEAGTVVQLIGDLMTKKKRSWLIVQNLALQIIILVAFFIFGPPTIEELEGWDGCQGLNSSVIHDGFCSSLDPRVN